jgi:polar amino acid transport system substrate-binding protein
MMWNSKKPMRHLALAAVAALIFLPMLGSPIAAADLELIVPGELSAATEGTFPPFSMQGASGQLDGLEIRVMGEIAKRLGLKYKPVVTKWESILIGLKADQHDISSAAMDITEERQKQVTFVDGWLESGGRLVVKRDSSVKTNAEIKGKTVGVLVASTWEKLATGLGATVKTYKSETDAIQDLVNGNVDGVITDSIAAAYMINASKLPLRMTDDYLSHVQKGFPVKQGKPNLVKAINKALADMIADGTYAKLTSDLVGYSPAPANPIRSQM